MRIGNLKYPLLILVAVGLAVASIALDEVRAPVHDHNTHSHDASLTGQPHSPLENKLQQAVAAETGFEMTNHEASEGSILMANNQEHIRELFNAQSCPAGAPTKEYDVAAIRLNLVLNRWGDRDPEAYMFALNSQVRAIRAQEAKANLEDQHFGVNLGVGADPIQPFTIRANVGDCVRVTFTNELIHPASFHIHGADLVLADTGDPALSTNPAYIAMPGQTVNYEWYLDRNYYGENTHYVHSHGPKSRYLVSHGLFGALIAEPEGSEYFDQRTGQPLCGLSQTGLENCRNSWDAIISPGDGSSDFREFAMFYHEIGNAKFAPVDKDGVPNPSIDPISQSQTQRPGYQLPERSIHAALGRHG